MPEYAGTHWSELVTKALGWELVTHAQQGQSNGGIRVQIEEAIRVRPEMVVITPTHSDRIEIPWTSSEVDWNNFSNNYVKLRDIFSNWLDPSRTEKGYDPALGIKNLNLNVNEPYRLVCETLWTLVSDIPGPSRKNRLKPEVLEAVRKYVEYLYDVSWKTQLDMWIIRDGVQQLKKHDIPYIFNPHVAWHHEDQAIDENSKLTQCQEFMGDLLDKTNYVTWTDRIHSSADNIPNWVDPGYHTTEEDQRKHAMVILKHIDSQLGTKPINSF